MTGDLNIEQPGALVAYLRHTGRIPVDEQPAIRILAGGVSNRTVLVERPKGDAWVVKQALAKLRVAVDWFSSPERIHCEAMGLRWLQQLAPPGTIPALVFEDHDHHLLGMQAVPQPHENWKSLLMAGWPRPEHVRQFAVLLATIHRAAFERQAEVAAVFEDRSFFETLRIEPYYSYTGEQVTAARCFLATLIEDTRACRVTLVHGDYSPKNVLVHRDRLVLLDHEVIHWGDPAFDLGFSLTHFLSKGHHFAPVRGDFAVAAKMYWDTYEQTLGRVPWARALEARAARHTLACLLARVAGRSPLEYLDGRERARQRAVVCELMVDPPQSIHGLVDTFVERLEAYAGD